MNKDTILAEYYVEPARVPVVDFQLLNSSDDAEQHAAVDQLDAAFRECGFVYICNHAIEPERVDQAFGWSRRFFAQSSETKELITHPPSGDIDDNRGWAKTGQGHTVQMVFDADEAEAFRQNNPDCKETLELGNPFSDKVPPNKWIPEHLLPGFRSFVESWWTDCAALSHCLYRSLGKALQIRDSDHFSHMHSENDCHMTWNFYPSMPLNGFHSPEAKRLNEHTDFGTLTLVFQDAVGGLEVHDGHRFRPIVPIPGAIVVNVGDMLERQSNGRWKSALHRVVAPAQLMRPRSAQVQDGHGHGSIEVIDRYSLVFFGVPNPDEMIETAPGCEAPGRWKPNMNGDWGTLSARQWIQKRLAVEY
ncbi:putative 2-oxoglutarate/Fe(II)-dependent dioxygenase [Tolypocladium ophioglossoides CBS 100239]|uniref:Putative 2-oxoglutarate/Fe(II)-dependent dioxygenase n=1 Tax=Tolypocladium ophioglossoides (strain CBS 100239) TaxID=1163406 RepID=A0A0L0NBJ6_TOLOC|nr:putative 2-oxoglutarate/Fe(II)-dependent dioxygenase [Tolypocladium ophioglossoides CBS 100239]